MTYDEAIKKIRYREYDGDMEIDELANVVTEGMREKFRAGEELSSSEINILLDWEIFPYELGDIIEAIRHGYVIREYIFEIEENEHYMLEFAHHYDYGIDDYAMPQAPKRCYFKKVAVEKWVCAGEDEYVFSHWNDDRISCFDCHICALGDMNCLAGTNENNFTPASKEQIITRLKNNEYPDYRQGMIDTLKEVYNVDWKEAEENAD